MDISNIPDLGSSQTVAATQGALNIVNGAAEYKVDIDLPPAIKDLKPKLALVYNSRSGNGLMGVGWGLSGLSAISRCSTRFAVEGAESQKSNPRYSNGDRLCLDGQKLVLADSSIVANDTNYWAIGAVYKTEIDNFFRIVAQSANNGAHAYFKVWTKDGRIMTYGGEDSLQNSRIYAPGTDTKGALSTWALDKVEDAYGNNYTVTYERDTANGAYYPLRINFAPEGAVVFKYQERIGQTPSGYDMGRAFKHAKVLDTITTYINVSTPSAVEAGTAVKKYEVEYKLSPDTQRELVDTLSECGYLGDSWNCAKPLSFQWQAGEFGFESSSRALVYCGSGLAIPSLGQFADVDGDGYIDAIHHLGSVSFGTINGCFDDGSWVGGGLGNITKAQAINTSFGSALLVTYGSGSEFYVGVIANINKVNKTKKILTALSYKATKNVPAVIANFNNDGLDDFIFDNRKYIQSTNLAFPSVAL